jgi:hypothetical protein
VGLGLCVSLCLAIFTGCSNGGSGTSPTPPSAPTIGTQPSNASAVVGSPATFSVVATGYPAPTYQWSKNGATISGATSSSYTTPAVVAGDSGSTFSVIVSNAGGSVTSSVVTLTVLSPPTISTQPASASVLAGATATFTVVASGTPTLTYQWSKGGVAISGATAASYTTPVLATTDNGNAYTVTVTNTAGSVTSSAATLTVSAKPAITSQPVAATAFIGDTASFSVVATGLPTPTYQWLLNGTAISAATTTTYVTPILASTDNGNSYTVAVTNSAGSVTSAPAVLTVNVKPVSITTQPSSTTVNDGSTASFSVVADGTAPISYQWYKNGTAIGGATTASYSYAAPYSDTGALFTVKVTNSAATVTSNAAVLTVNVAPINITAQPTAPITRFVGETNTFTITATGTSPTYQWRRNSAAISGATSATYTTPVLASGDNGASYDVLVSNAAGTVNSSAAVLKVGPFATTYTTQQGVVLSMYAWPGAKMAFLTKATTYDGPTMRKILTAADGTWNYYAGSTGTLPSYFFVYNGLATIANTGVGGVNLCGDGCTYIGATGMELSDNATGWLYNGVLNNTGYDQVMFYEMGRSFWLFPNLQYQSPADSSCEVTGYAVLMRYRSLSAQGYTGLFGGSASAYTSQYANSLGMIDTYAGDSSLNFNNTFLTNSFTSPYGGCSDLWAAMVIRLANNYGGEAFIQSLFKQVLLRAAATTTQTAIDNFVLAASAAAGKNLTLTFGTTWKWPISTAAAQEAQSRWGNPQ